MRKLPLVMIVVLVLAVAFLALFQPDLLKPHNPYLTPSVTSNPTNGEQITLSAAPDTQTPTLTPTYTPTLPSPTVTILPLPTQIMPTPGTPVGILEVTLADRASLAKLCVIEVRDLVPNSVRRDACLSIISTVITRTLNRIISDGTIAGTIGWNCTATSQTCQFPASVLGTGCDGLIPVACAYNYPNDLAFFKVVVDQYFNQAARGSCDGYIYYGITPLDPPECRIEDSHGMYTNWHKKFIATP